MCGDAVYSMRFIHAGISAITTHMSGGNEHARNKELGLGPRVQHVFHFTLLYRAGLRCGLRSGQKQVLCPRLQLER